MPHRLQWHVDIDRSHEEENLMRAIVIEKPGEPDALQIKEIPTPEPEAGWVRIKVKAFGLNRAEMFTRQGHSPGVEFPRVIGIEAVGMIDAAPNGEFEAGQKVVTLMGGMGRQFDGSYAEYTCVPATNIFPLETDLAWETLGAIPEMFQTVYGSLTLGLEVEHGQTLLIRGGTSSIGMLATTIAKDMGLTVLATTRNPKKAETLRANGVDHVVIDGESLIEPVHEIAPQGVDRVLELIGTKTLGDSLRCTKPRGIVCMTGILGNEWVWKNFEPFLDIPTGVKLTAYSGNVGNLSAEALQDFVDDVAAGRKSVAVDRVFQFDEIVEAHRYMESNQASGKLVVVVDGD